MESKKYLFQSFYYDVDDFSVWRNLRYHDIH